MSDEAAGKAGSGGKAGQARAGVPVAAAKCPGCGKSLRTDALICIECGFDKRKGLQRDTGIGATKVRGGSTTCSGCGYSLVGLKGRVCPECGIENVPKSWRDHSKVEGARVVRRAYEVPAVMLGAGLLLGVVTLAVAGFSELIPRYFLALTLSTALGTSAFFLLCLTWIGFDAPIHLTALRLGAIDALVTAAMLAVLLFLPGFGLVAFLIWGGSIILTAKMLEIEVVEAFVLGLIKGVLRIGLAAMGAGFSLES